MLTIIDWSTALVTEKKQRLTRAPQSNSIRAAVQNIITAVREQGDVAAMDFTQKFDGIDLSSFVIPNRDLDKASITKDALQAINTAIQTITTYHEAMMPTSTQVKTANGVAITRIYRPIERVGLYVPGGRNTPLISSLLMQAIPARIAGCPIRVLCTPPNSNGKIDPNLLVAAKLCGIETLYAIGGAQAIAAMAYGTESIPKVDKIFGPGNAYVTEAKALVSLDPAGAAIDMPAGPSEVMIIADEQANPAFVAADLLAQAEHGPDSQVLCICESELFALKVMEAVNQQLKQLSRKELTLGALQNSTLIVCANRAEQLAIINDYAPEHLIINRVDAREWVDDIKSAGTIFLGPWAAETMGDYITGSNHVLPTNGYARSYSGLNTIDFLKAISVQSINELGMQLLGPAAYTLANLEGLDAHANAVQLRLDALGGLL